MTLSITGLDSLNGEVCVVNERRAVCVCVCARMWVYVRVYTRVCTRAVQISRKAEQVTCACFLDVQKKQSCMQHPALIPSDAKDILCL